MKKLFLLAVLSLFTAVSSFALNYVTIAYYGDGSKGCWPQGGACLHIVTIVYSMQALPGEFNNNNIAVPQGATMGLITAGAQQGQYSYFDQLTAPICDDPQDPAQGYVIIPSQDAVWSSQLGGYLVYFYQQ